MSRRDSDEAYVLDLCDEAIGSPGSRQHRFDWLLGDPGGSGRQVRLPVDAYWPDVGIVVEYRERQHDNPTPHFDKPDKLTVSGIHRGLQRALYDKRREELIPRNDLRLVIIKPTDLDATVRGRLRRGVDHDRVAIARLLAASDHRDVSKASVKRFAEQSTKASAQIEHRSVPQGFVRPAKVERFLAERPSRS